MDPYQRMGEKWREREKSLANKTEREKKKHTHKYAKLKMGYITANK